MRNAWTHFFTPAVMQGLSSEVRESNECNGFAAVVRRQAERLGPTNIRLGFLTVRKALSALGKLRCITPDHDEGHFWVAQGVFGLDPKTWMLSLHPSAGSSTGDRATHRTLIATFQSQTVTAVSKRFFDMKVPFSWA